MSIFSILKDLFFLYGLFIISMVFLYLSKLLFSGFIQIKATSVGGRNYSKYCESAPKEVEILQSLYKMSYIYCISENWLHVDLILFFPLHNLFASLLLVRIEVIYIIIAITFRISRARCRKTQPSIMQGSPWEA